ncbi:MAG TPA: 1-deoxy-D-xylulose-5-phosphate synthase [Bacteroidetes bacterium]|nr:1-deoxy-D-xylulose-5-phosphate synthase [Bacteroidota bacterium]
MDLLEKIKKSGDIHQFTRKELRLLAGEIRKRIIDVVSKNGGHLASSLGAVELTLAVHYVFDLPKDTLIWDVGHQAYAHKLLTGRNDRFDTLRQYKGISGFTKIKESPYDGFTVGHSSTSISAGLGVCYGKYLNGDDSNVISIIGDGSLTAGLAYEGLNQAGVLKKRNLIVILNDNDMSISPNVGALSSFLSRTFSAKYLQSMRNQFGAFLKSLPKIGDEIYHIAKRSEESFKTFITPGMLFEAFNFDYFGPIDGHNLDHLIDILKNIKNPKDPVLLHVTTKKGKGYEPAEKNPVYYHGVGSFTIDTGKSNAKPNGSPSYTQVFGSQMVNLGRKNSKIVAVTAAMPEGTGLIEFSNQFPDRFFDVGIAEQHAVTFSAGLASRGLKPVVAIYSTFLQRAFDQILHDVCIDAHPVVFAIDRGGIVGEDGPTHHGLFDYSYLRCMPNMTIMAPKDENELRDMLFTAIEQRNCPVAIRYPRGNSLGLPLKQKFETIKIGKSETVRAGQDVAILSVGTSVTQSLKAADLLEKDGILAEVVNMRFIKPLDTELLEDITNRFTTIITVEENSIVGGFGSAVLEALSAMNKTNLNVKLHGLMDGYITQGTPSELLQLTKLDAEGIAEIVKNFYQLHSEQSKNSGRKAQ